MSPFSDAHRRFRFWLMIFLSFLSLVALVAALYAVFGTSQTTEEIRDTQLEGTPLGQRIAQSTDDTATTLALLKDCLDPAGECGKRSAASQQTALGSIRDDMFTIAACIDKPGRQTQAQIRRCYERHGHEKTPGSP